MFAMRVRVRPCRLLWKPSSLGRSTRITPSSRTTRISGCKRRDRVPRGPFTVTVVSWSIATSTPAGISMGCLPIRLMASSSPHVGQDLAADATARGLPVSDHALGCGQDGDAEPAHDPGKLVAHGVHAATWGGDAAQAGDGPLPLRPVLQADPKGLVDALALSLEASTNPSVARILRMAWLSLDAGTSRSSLYATLAFRILVSMSATGSVTLVRTRAFTMMPSSPPAAHRCAQARGSRSGTAGTCGTRPEPPRTGTPARSTAPCLRRPSSPSSRR